MPPSLLNIFDYDGNIIQKIRVRHVILFQYALKLILARIYFNNIDFQSH